jgi:hypothetical protein
MQVVRRRGNSELNEEPAFRRADRENTELPMSGGSQATKRDVDYATSSGIGTSGRAEWSPFGWAPAWCNSSITISSAQPDRPSPDRSEERWPQPGRRSNRPDSGSSRRTARVYPPSWPAGPPIADWGVAAGTWRVCGASQSPPRTRRGSGPVRPDYRSRIVPTLPSRG